jgi:hypothetical protein
MNKEFIPYELALELKNLGFREDCLGWFDETELRIGHIDITHMLYKEEILAPMFSQAFRWFREKDLYCIVYKYHDGFAYEVYGEGLQIIKEPYNTYKEAELECLKELIKIVKNK